MSETEAARLLSAIQRANPFWSVWYVRAPSGGAVAWYARRKGHAVSILEAATPDGLVSQLRRAA